MVYVGGVYLILHLGIVLQYLIGAFKQKTLRRHARGLTLLEYPLISIIAPARNEERHIERAVRSLLALSYPNLEILVVNDRSTDGTGEVLSRLARENPRLRVMEIKTLPPKWLGKNHALAVGAQAARGELLLFTDADVRFSPECLQWAVAYLVHHRLDHLVLYPALVAGSPWLYPVTCFFGLLFTLAFPPWKAEDPKSGVALGIGAFNLVRKTVYEGVGGHEKIRLRPDDDMKLGYLIKQAGFRQACLVGSGDLEVPWYDSLSEFTRGLEKNVYSGCDYLRWQIPHMALSPFFLFVLPFGLVFFAQGLAQTFLLVTVGLILFSYGGVVYHSRAPWWSALFLPPAGLFVTYVLLRSIYLTEKRGGIYWRETFYPLQTLKENRFGWNPRVKKSDLRKAA